MVWEPIPNGQTDRQSHRQSHRQTEFYNIRLWVEVSQNTDQIYENT